MVPMIVNRPQIMLMIKFVEVKKSFIAVHLPFCVPNFMSLYSGAQKVWADKQ